MAIKDSTRRILLTISILLLLLAFVLVLVFLKPAYKSPWLIACTFLPPAVVNLVALLYLDALRESKTPQIIFWHLTILPIIFGLYLEIDPIAFLLPLWAYQVSGAILEMTLATFLDLNSWYGFLSWLISFDMYLGGKGIGLWTVCVPFILYFAMLWLEKEVGGNQEENQEIAPPAPATELSVSTQV